MDANYALTPQKYLLPLEVAELSRLLEKFRVVDLRNTTMLLFMLETGARPTEVLNVCWGDFSHEFASVYLRTLKGGRNRNIPLKPGLRERLALMKGSLADVEARLFPIGYNRFCNIWHDFRPVKKKLHALRHTFAIQLYRSSGYNLRLVQLALGHRYLMTTSIYLEIEENEAELRNALLGMPS